MNFPIIFFVWKQKIWIVSRTYKSERSLTNTNSSLCKLCFRRKKKKMMSIHINTNTNKPIVSISNLENYILRYICFSYEMFKTLTEWHKETALFLVGIFSLIDRTWLSHTESVKEHATRWQIVSPVFPHRQLTVCRFPHLLICSPLRIVHPLCHFIVQHFPRLIVVVWGYCLSVSWLCLHCLWIYNKA